GLACASPAGIAGAQQACGWMGTQELDRLLPQAAPWRVMVGGQVGSCKFLGRAQGQGTPIIGANQMIQSSEARARELARSLRGNLPDGYQLHPVEDLGAEGFYYSDANGRSTSFVGHRGAVAITGQLVLPMGADLAAWKKGAIG